MEAEENLPSMGPPLGGSGWQPGMPPPVAASKPKKKDEDGKARRKREQAKSAFDELLGGGVDEKAGVSAAFPTSRGLVGSKR